MSIYTLLRKDHDQIRNILILLENTRNTEQQRHNLIAQLRVEIITHNKAEENVFYKALTRRDATFVDYIERSKEENAQVEALLNEVQDAKKAEAWDAAFQKLKEAIESHIDAEEAEVFSVAESNFSAKEADILADEMRSEKNRIKERVLQAKKRVA